MAAIVYHHVLFMMMICLSALILFSTTQIHAARHDQYYAQDVNPAASHVVPHVCHKYLKPSDPKMLETCIKSSDHADATCLPEILTSLYAPEGGPIGPTCCKVILQFDKDCVQNAFGHTPFYYSLLKQYCQLSSQTPADCTGDRLPSPPPPPPQNHTLSPIITPILTPPPSESFPSPASPPSESIPSPYPSPSESIPSSPSPSPSESIPSSPSPSPSESNAHSPSPQTSAVSPSENPQLPSPVPSISPVSTTPSESNIPSPSPSIIHPPPPSSPRPESPKVSPHPPPSSTTSPPPPPLSSPSDSNHTSFPFAFPPNLQLPQVQGSGDGCWEGAGETNTCWYPKEFDIARACCYINLRKGHDCQTGRFWEDEVRTCCSWYNDGFGSRCFNMN